MFPKNITTIIDNYNEIGTFIIVDLKWIYWFNGKRFEIWCRCPNNGAIIYHIGLKLYHANLQNNEVRYLKQNDWVKTHRNFQYNSQWIKDNNKIYYIQCDEYLKRNNGTITPKRNSSHLCGQYIYYEKQIYWFSISNEKYDIEKNIWSTISSPFNRHVCRWVGLIKDNFYALMHDCDKPNYFHIYNPKLDLWQKSNITYPFKNIWTVCNRT